jgi:hypothetical protein
MESNAEIRKELGRALGRQRLRTGLWTHLVHWGFVARVARGEWTIDRLATIYETSEETLYPARRARQQVVREFTPGLRADALAEMLAIDAMVPFSGVKDFRERFLDGKALALREVDEWVHQQAAIEGAAADSYLSVPVSRDNPLWIHPGIEQSCDEYARWLEREAARLRETPDCELPGSQASSRPTLTYISADNREHQVKIRGHGPLAYLKMIAYGRSQQFSGSWTEAEAVTFILTNLRPNVVGMTLKAPFAAFPAAAAQIKIRVNPRVPPRDLAKAYAKARLRYVAERDRTMTPKHLTLAVFVHGRRFATTPWVKMREEWNKAYPKWRFGVATDPEARRFALEARTAWSRVSGDRWPDRRKRSRLDW